MCSQGTQTLLVEPGPRLEQTQGGFAEFGGLVAGDAPGFPCALPRQTAGVLTRLLLHPLVRGGLQPPLVHHLPQGVDGGAVDGPLGDAHLAQVGAGVAGQTFAVLKILPAELAADVPRGFGFVGDGCGATERNGCHV